MMDRDDRGIRCACHMMPDMASARMNSETRSDDTDNTLPEAGAAGSTPVP